MGDDDRPDRSDRSDRRDRLDHPDATDPRPFDPEFGSESDPEVRPEPGPQLPSLTDREFAERFDLIVANWEGFPTAGMDDADSDGDSDERADRASAHADGPTGRPTGEPTRSRTDVPPAADRPHEIHIESRSMRELASEQPERPEQREQPEAAGRPEQHGPTDWRVHIPPDDPDDEEYVPPPPRPLPTGDLGFWGALIGLIGGPLWLVYLAVTQNGSRLTIGAAVAMTVAGFAIIVARQPRRGQREDDDDGAVV